MKNKKTLPTEGSRQSADRGERKQARLLIIDSNSLIHRAYHALPVLTTKKGEPTNAIYGFLLVFLRSLKEFSPDFIVATFDLPAPTFRHKKFKAYKAKRPPAPQELYDQIPKVKELLRLFNVPVFEKAGFEADDIIGTIAKLAPRKQVYPEIESIVLSGDLDTLQLVDKNTKIYLLRKGVKDIILYDKDAVREKYHGLGVDQLVDFRALKGDSSDNIPGVTGIGEKTAIDLLLRFGDLEKIYEEIEKKSEKISAIKPKIKELLIKYKEQAFISQYLAQINREAISEFTLKKWGNYKKEELIRVFNDLEFQSLISRLPSGEGLSNSSYKTDKDPSNNEEAQRLL